MPEAPIKTDWSKTTVLEMMNSRPQGKWWESQMLTGPEESEHGWFEDAQAFHKTAILGSWNALVRVHVYGPDAEKVLMRYCANTFKNYTVGKVKHGIFCNKDGKVIINGIFIHDAENSYVFTGGPHALWVKYVADKSGLDVKTELLQEFSWSVSGPTSLYIAEKACGESLRDLAFMHYRYVTIDGVKCRCIRQSMSAEIGYEFQGPIEYNEKVQAALVEAGKGFGLVEYGGKGGLTQEVESGFLQTYCDYLPAVMSESPEDKEFRTWMEDYVPGFYNAMMKRSGSFEYDRVEDLYMSPTEMGEGRMCKFDHDYLGKEALMAEAENPKRVCRSLVWDSQDVIDIYASLFERGEKPYRLIEIPHFPVSFTYSDKVIDRENRVIGHTSRNMYSPWYRCYFCSTVIDKEYAEPGTRVAVVYGDPGGRQKVVHATVAPLRFKEDHRRDDVTALPAYPATPEQVKAFLGRDWGF
ncbi:MAG: hypothetical protein ACOYJL_00670 [Tractidigestivibacter sp.]|jgi:vanillate/3-O-methylgallate O-demethylase|uniref:hypothetical protein n=1 Tax=Tractidigestivibacter sp. TaxID=2847320 RepID=UPI003D92719A